MRNAEGVAPSVAEIMDAYKISADQAQAFYERYK